MNSALSRSRALLLAAGTLVLALGLGSFGGSAAANSTGGGASDQNLLLGIHLDIDSLNPFVAVQVSSLAVYEYTYPALVQYNTALQIVPYFATSWQQSTNGLTWTFTTRSHAKWSDGTPLTAADAAWTINTVLKYATGGAAELAGYLAGVKSASAPNADTLVVHMAQPEAAFLADIREMPILPKEVWSRYATGTKGATLKTFANDPSPGHPVVGGGPFMVTSYDKLGVTILERNPNYFGSKPDVAELGIEYFSSPDAELEALKDGQIDAVWTVVPSGANSLKADKSLVVHSQPGLNVHDFIFNDYSKQKTDLALTLPVVHQAFDYAINRSEIVKYAFDGYAQPASSPILSATGKWHDPAIKTPPYDLAKANQLLNEAGFKMGANGVRIADGQPMSYTVYMADDELGPGTEVFQIMKGDFQKIGVQLTLEALTDSTAATYTVQPSTKFHLMMWGWTPPPDPSFMLNTYTCTQFGGWSETGFCNATYDKLFDEQSAATTPTKRLQIVYQMEQVLAKDIPEIMYADQDWIDAWSTKWTGFGETAQGFFTPLTTMGLVHVHET